MPTMRPKERHARLAELEIVFADQQRRIRTMLRQVGVENDAEGDEEYPIHMTKLRRKLLNKEEYNVERRG